MRISTGFVTVVALVCGGLAAAPGSAEEKRDHFVTSPEVAAAQAAAQELQLQIIERHRSGQSSPDSFGTQCCQILQIPAAAFQAFDGVEPQNGNLGYMFPSTFGAPFDFWAPVQLPTGARIVFLDLYYEDTNAFDFNIHLRALSGGSSVSGPPAGFNIATVSSTGAGGYGYAATALNYRVNNNVALDPNGAQLIVGTFFGVTSGTQKFKAVDIWWQRDISPAPVTQGFNDVPPGAFGYQQIEALSASGITGGCGGGNYCPNATLTRAQMAIFLSKALGLYWPF